MDLATAPRAELGQVRWKIAENAQEEHGRTHVLRLEVYISMRLKPTIGDFRCSRNLCQVKLTPILRVESETCLDQGHMHQQKNDVGERTHRFKLLKLS